MKTFRMHDCEKPNRCVPSINRKLTGLLNNYAGKIRILYLHFSESSWQHSQWRNYIAIWNTYIFVDSLPHSLDIYRMSRSTSQWNQQDTCRLANRKKLTEICLEKGKLKNKNSDKTIQNESIYIRKGFLYICDLVCENITAYKFALKKHYSSYSL